MWRAPGACARRLQLSLRRASAIGWPMEPHYYVLKCGLPFRPGMRPPEAFAMDLVSQAEADRDARQRLWSPPARVTCAWRWCGNEDAITGHWIHGGCQRDFVEFGISRRLDVKPEK